VRVEAIGPLRSFTPGASRFVNSTPADSKARRMASIADCLASEPFSILVTVFAVMPLIVPGCAVDADEHDLRLTAWTNIPFLGGQEAERRVIVRFAMPINAARAPEGH
jgi:hypothetical protein